MDDSQVTRASLLIRLQGPTDRQAWPDFVDIYSPIIYGFARRQGLQDADAADLAQDVLLSVSKSIQNYDRQRGPFRHWLMAVVRNCLSDFWRKSSRRTSGTGDTDVIGQLEQIPSQEDAERVWDEEFRRSVFRFAADSVRNNFEQSTWESFRLTSVEGRKTKEAAKLLGISEGAVYVARCRVLAHIRQVVKSMED